MKALCALFVIASLSALLAEVMPALAADLPDQPAPVPAQVYPPVHAPRARVYIVPGCRLGTERWWDGYGWHIRDIQVCR